MLIDEAQRIFGKMFRTYDIGILVGIVERLGFDEASVLLMLNYVAGKGKKTMRYAETLAMSFYDDGVTSAEAVAERISRMERSGELIEQIKRLGEKDANSENASEYISVEKKGEPSVPREESVATVGTEKTGERSRRRELLCALKPYVSEQRGRAIDSMMSIADILDVMRTK
jgi:hypothetical protein